MNYTEALNYINDKEKFGSRLGLEVIGKLLELLGNPHLDGRYIHIAGTNGKGSTSSYLTAALKEAGYDVGLFISPYLERFNERISINGEDIPDERLAEITKRIKDKIKIMVAEGYEHPTTFEIVTTIAFVYFSEEEPDYVVLEVGLGGRADSTNIIEESLASVITTIDYDHIDVLGNTLEMIAYEKAGIIKRKGLVITYPQQKEARRIIRQVCSEQLAELIEYPMDNIHIRELGESGGRFDFLYEDTLYEDFKIGLIGKHQIYNASLALMTLFTLRDKGLIDIDDGQIRAGLEKARWKGRLEILRRNPTFLIDGAHNLQGVQTLVDSLKGFKYNRLILGIGILKDKDIDHIIETIIPLADEVVVTEVDMPRKMEAVSLAKKLNGYNINTYIEQDIEKAIAKAYRLANEDDLIVFGGSLYLIGDVRRILLESY
ncbi:MAG: bifunctional folylpolyglutamate synthase/dihydrofolate synthase [Tissierellia bacterium]|nr:bifunctional folylpolyglutamate synthase/dihydrofolate synthase [Tissierellia bacterium]